ncbi:VOC family protein [Polymorphobacter sp.]|uniref:VOC family protein n=1 Tax=Polymorphobacter sp. TaxID=1909290 RepID=UPI003F72AE97
MTATPARLGPFRGATIVCQDVDRAMALYTDTLGFEPVENGRIAANVAASWGALGVAGARFGVLAPRSGAPFHLRFVEQPDTPPAAPYLSTGWTALEFTVTSSDTTIERLKAAGFEVLGAAEDLEFSKGALRAGQVQGPFGEVLYLTQINRQLDDYVLPHAQSDVDRMFIAILATRDVHGCMDHYHSEFGCPKKDTFEAAVPFIARAHGFGETHEYFVGTVELAPENYIEIDGMPTHLPDRTGEAHRQPGLLPAGVALVSMTTPDLAPFRARAAGPAIAATATRGESLTITGYHGELIELIETR